MHSSDEVNPPVSSLIVLEYRRPDLIVERPLISIKAQISYVLTGAILPVICFALSAGSYPPGPDFQRGQWNDYLGLIPTAKVGWPFYPLLIFSIYALTRIVFQPRKAIDRLHVRIGIFSGVLLAFQYSFILASCVVEFHSQTVDIVLSLLLPPIFVAVVLFLSWLSTLLIWNSPWYQGRGKIWFWVSLVIMSIVCLVLLPRSINLLEFALIGPLILAPLLALTVFVSVAILIARKGTRSHKPLIAMLLLPGAWLAAFAGAWTEAYLNAVKAYAALPVSNPNCYIATAAAHGHSRIVRSVKSGNTCFSPQLAIFKAGEVAIAAYAPYAHKLMRKIYDCIGPALARWMSNAYIADSVYFSLKPFEWLTVFTLVILRVV